MTAFAVVIPSEVEGSARAFSERPHRQTTTGVVMSGKPELVIAAFLTAK
jgi:hypothetical protein